MTNKLVYFFLNSDIGDVGNEVGKLNDCIHTFCFDCIKDWSDVTNECPLCKRKFNEITKYLLKEGGVSVKLETLPVEDKKQRVHDDGGDFVDEDEGKNYLDLSANKN